MSAHIPEPMNLHAVRTVLARHRFGHTIEHHVSLGSTNDRADELAGGGAAEGVVVVADTQTAGRGRLGREWLDKPGECLLMSIVLRPTFQRTAWPLVGLAAATSAAHAVRSLAGVPARTKWPNDIIMLAEVCGGTQPAKLGGVLMETQSDWAILGIGVNVLDAPDAPAVHGGLPAASVGEHCSEAPCRAGLLVALLGRLEEFYGLLECGSTDAVLAAYAELDTTVGRTVTLSSGSEQVGGRAKGIDASGALLVETGEGLRRFVAGEVSLSAATNTYMDPKH